nr:hypothetical protein [Tanacetum cinerariifolium]
MLNDVNTRTKKPNVVPISTREPKGHANKSVATPHKKTVASESATQKSKSYYRMLKPSIKNLHIFSCTCYLTRDGENLDKMKEKGDPCILALFPDNKRHQIMTTLAPSPNYKNVSPLADTIALSQQQLDLLFGPMYDEFFNKGTLSVNKSSSPTNNSKQQDTPPTMNNQSSTEPTTPTSNIHAKENNDHQAEDTQFQQDEFINPFYTLVQEVAESSSCNIDNLNVHTFNQP